MAAASGADRPDFDVVAKDLDALVQAFLGERALRDEALGVFDAVGLDEAEIALAGAVAVAERADFLAPEAPNVCFRPITDIRLGFWYPLMTLFGGAIPWRRMWSDLPIMIRNIAATSEQRGPCSLW